MHSTPTRPQSAVHAGQVKVPPGYHPIDVEKEWGRLHVAILERERLLRIEFERYGAAAGMQQYLQFLWIEFLLRSFFFQPRSVAVTRRNSIEIKSKKVHIQLVYESTFITNVTMPMNAGHRCTGEDTDRYIHTVCIRRDGTRRVALIIT